MALMPVDARVAIWVPCIAFAVLYSLFFVFTGLTTLNPKLWADAKAAILSCGKSRRRKGAGGAIANASAGASTGGAGAGDKSGTAAPPSERGRSGGGGAALARAVAPVVLTWEGLGCEYNTREGPLTVLQDVSGEARPREMVALMGPSGSGKSTLIDMLAARKSLGKLSGRVLVNGRSRTNAFRRISSYVPQEDNLSPIMNVAETCLLYANLTLPRGTAPAAAAARIDEVLADMGMLHARDRLVGGVLPGGLLLRGLSGGERKRLWVAVGIIATPSVLFLDEPTTGLDSCAAFAVVNLMRRTAADSGLTVVASIHQPCSAVFAAFDACALLAHGSLLYHGPRAGMGPWFEGALGLGPWNPAEHGIVSDWAMDLVSVEFTKPKEHGRTIDSLQELRDASAAFAKQYRETRAAGAAEAPPPDAAPARKARGSDAAGGAGARSGGGAAAAPADGGDDDAGAAAEGRVSVKVSGSGSAVSEGGAEDAALAGAGQRATWMMQFRMLLWRELLSTMRNPVDVAGRMLCFTVLAVFTGLVYWNLDEGVDGMRNRINLLFINSMFLLLMPFVYMSLYAQDKRTCVADFSARLYSVSAYYVAKQIAVLPFVLANVGANAFLVIGMVGLRTEPGAMFTYAGIGVVYYLLAQQVQALAAIITPNQEGAFVVTITYSSINLLMSNYIMRFKDMEQSWLSGLRWVSATNYAFSAYMRNQFQGSTVSCAVGLDPDLVQTLQQTLQSLMPNTSMLRSSAVERMLLRPGPDCIMNLDAILDYFGVNYEVWVYAIALLVYLLVIHGLTFWGLLRLASKERR
ncbi:MAG: hypothetical protein J3K34DRAFT_517194 [Monoraphidium minutum]|nr:MAG: hypothetical protein J3K34DRAFT_517194 [Monoraphidium minutum]